MAPFHDVDAVKGYVARAIGDGPRGTQNRLALQLAVPTSTVNKWAKGVQCPSPKYWPAIEVFFGWVPGSLAGVAGVGPVPAADVEAAILATDDLDDFNRATLLRLYRMLKADSVRSGRLRGR